MVNFFQDDTRGAARKLQIITALAVFRVMKIPTLKIPNSLLLSDLQVALAEAVLWRWQAEQRHGPRRIAKHPELSGLLPLPACKVQSSELSLLCLNDLRARGAEKDLAAAGVQLTAVRIMPGISGRSAWPRCFGRERLGRRRVGEPAMKIPGT